MTRAADGTSGFRDTALYSTLMEYARIRCSCSSPGEGYTLRHVSRGIHLAYVDPECEANLTFYTAAVQRACRPPGTPLPPFPRVGRVAQRHDDWDVHHVQPNGGGRSSGHSETSTATAQRRATKVGINPGYDIDSGPARRMKHCLRWTHLHHPRDARQQTPTVRGPMVKTS